MHAGRSSAQSMRAITAFNAERQRFEASRPTRPRTAASDRADISQVSNGTRDAYGAIARIGILIANNATAIAQFLRDHDRRKCSGRDFDKCRAAPRSFSASAGGMIGNAVSCECE